MVRPGLDLICRHKPHTTVRVNQSQELERTRAAAFQSNEWSRTNIRPSLGARESTFIDPNWSSKKISRSQSSQPEDSKVRSRQK